MTETKIAMTIEEASEYTGIGRNTMRNLVERGKLPVLKAGRKVLSGMDSKQCMISTEPMPSPKPLMPNIGIKPTVGKNVAEKMHKDRQKKAYTGGCRIMKEQMQTNNQDKPLKAGTGGQDKSPSVF